MDRRLFLNGAIALISAPAIVKAENIMRIATIYEVKMVTNERHSFNEFQCHMLREIANSLDIPYSLLAKDFNGRNMQQAIDKHSGQPAFYSAIYPLTNT